MNIKEIKELIEMIDTSNLTEFEYVNSGEKLILKKQKDIVISNQEISVPQKTNPAVTVNTDTEVKETISKSEVKDKNLVEITSPIVGTFYSASSPDSAPYVKIGDKVKKGEILCIIEAMKLMNEITAEFDCEIVEIVVKNQEMVEFGKPLFLVKALN